ncbi:MAG: hypothetical protein Aureis2KO_13270 [Aureisphaera sp.]
MRSGILISMLFIVCLSCKRQAPEDHIPNLQGYWEIEQVILSDGSVRNFEINTLIDYIEVQGDSGARKKLAPKLDGSFRTTKVSEKFYLKTDADSLRLHYKTPFSEWTETVLKSGDSLLQVRNEDGKIYTYKRFKPINLN